MKNVRSDLTYIISQDSTDNPKLGAKILSSGKESLFLDFYLGSLRTVDEDSGKVTVRKSRRREYLKLYLHQNPRSAGDRTENRQTLELAKSIRFQRAQELLQARKGYSLRTDRTDCSLEEFFEGYLASYTKRDVRMIRCAMNRFRDFLGQYLSPDGQRTATGLMVMSEISGQMVEAFTDYLQGRSRGLGAHTIYARFKKIIRYALENGYLREDPCRGIRITADNSILRKEILSPQEQEQLILCHYQGENPEVRRAFILSLYCGLRFCDVSILTYRNVDYANRMLRFEQSKTRGHSSRSGVVIPLTQDLIQLIGRPAPGMSPDGRIFSLPTYGGCISDLRSWLRHAGISKHITWHSARHSFALCILNNGANIKTLSSLLGHSSISQTEKYIRAVDRLKIEAIQSLPKIRF